MERRFGHCVNRCTASCRDREGSSPIIWATYSSKWKGILTAALNPSNKLSKPTDFRARHWPSSSLWEAASTQWWIYLSLLVTRTFRQPPRRGGWITGLCTIATVPGTASWAREPLETSVLPVTREPGPLPRAHAVKFVPACPRGWKEGSVLSMLMTSLRNLPFASFSTWSQSSAKIWKAPAWPATRSVGPSFGDETHFFKVSFLPKALEIRCGWNNCHRNSEQATQVSVQHPQD